MLLRPVPDFYSSKHPVASDVLLVIEVADSSIEYDQIQKLALYAEHYIPEYWILNLDESRLEVYRQPQEKSYREKTSLHSGDKITPLKLTGVTISLEDIL